MKIKDQIPTHNMKAKTTKLDGVIIGVLVAINKNNKPLVVFPSNLEETGVIAKSTATLEKKDIGCEVALLFEGGDVRKPIVIGLIQHPEDASFHEIKKPVEVELDDEHLVLKAKQSITLKCGEASITLTKAGKILLRGSYVLSRSSGANRIKGGSVQIN